MPTETFSLGAPVELNAISRELKNLWQEGEGAMARASLINLAIYSEETGSLERNTQLIAKITDPQTGWGDPWAQFHGETWPSPKEET